MKGLKKHTHQDRRKVIEEIIPLVREKFGENLIALAAEASFARGEDMDYSDLELTAFVKEMSKNQDWDGIGKIRDGLLVELVWMTRESYLRRTLEITENWYLAGSNVLLPIINEKFINELNKYRVENIKEKCLKQAKEHWREVQESTAKVLNAIRAKNRDGIPLLAFDMTRHMLISLSFLNHTPYITFARFVSQARSFEIKPSSFENLLDIIVQGAYQDLPRLKNTVERVFSQFETIFEDFGIELYDKDINPS
jgi:hypothetical protein